MVNITVSYQGHVKAGHSILYRDDLFRPSILESLNPRGSKYPTFKDSDPRNHTLDDCWDQSPEILGPGTLWE